MYVWDVGADDSEELYFSVCVEHMGMGWYLNIDKGGG